MWLVLGRYKSICLASPLKPPLALYSPLLLCIARPVCAYGLWQGIWPLPEEIRPSTSPLQGPHPTHTRWSSVDEWPTTSINLIILLSVHRLCMMDYTNYTEQSLHFFKCFWTSRLHPSFTYCIISWPAMWRRRGTLVNLQSGEAGEQSFDPPVSVQNFPSYWCNFQQFPAPVSYFYDIHQFQNQSLQLYNLEIVYTTSPLLLTYHHLFIVTIKQAIYKF